MEQPSGEESQAMKEWIRTMQKWIEANVASVMSRKGSADSSQDLDGESFAYVHGVFTVAPILMSHSVMIVSPTHLTMVARYWMLRTRDRSRWNQARLFTPILLTYTPTKTLVLHAQLHPHGSVLTFSLTLEVVALSAPP